MRVLAQQLPPRVGERYQHCFAKRTCGAAQTRWYTNLDGHARAGGGEDHTGRVN